MMKKIITILLAAGMTAFLTACGRPGSTAAGENGGGFTGIEDVELDTEGAAGNVAGENGGNFGKENGDAAGGLRPLAGFNQEGCATMDGYYYLTFESVKLADGNYGSHLMYMDFDSGQEVYLCNNAGCNHDTAECPSVFLYDEFPSAETLLFVHGNGLYLLSKDSDSDGSMQSNISFEGEPAASSTEDSRSATLYRTNLDGTGREKVYTFPAGLILEDFVLGDEKGIYVVTKKLTADKSGADTYINSSERRLVYLDLEKRQEQEVCSMDFDGTFSWRVKGCFSSKLVLEGTDYGREVSNEEIFDDDAYKNLYEKSKERYATLDLTSGQLNQVYSIGNEEMNSAVTENGVLYVSSAVDNSVKAVDLDTGEEELLCGGMDQYYYLYDKIGNKLRCENETYDSTFTYLDVNTGDICHSSLVNKSLGWSLEVRAVVGSDVLVIYDYEATPNGDGSYEITRYQYGLISQEDLFAGRENYRKIDMIGAGW